MEILQECDCGISAYDEKGKIVGTKVFFETTKKKCLISEGKFSYLNIFYKDNTRHSPGGFWKIENNF